MLKNCNIKVWIELCEKLYKNMFETEGNPKILEIDDLSKNSSGNISEKSLESEENISHDNNYSFSNSLDEELSNSFNSER